MPKKGVTLAKAVDAFVSQPDLAPATGRSYRQTLAAVVDALDPELPIGELEPARLERLLEQRWGKAAPATWNCPLATLRSFLSFCRRRSWVADARLEAKRRREHEDRTRSIPAVELERLWRRQDLVANKRARIRSKGGAIELAHFQMGGAPAWLPRSPAHTVGRSAATRTNGASPCAACSVGCASPVLAGTTASAGRRRNRPSAR
jgi:hypothetical protein